MIRHNYITLASNIPHWSDGGNAVTNFSAYQIELYARAIQASGDIDLYIGVPTLKGSVHDLALRDSRGMPRDLGDFWKAFRQVEQGLL